MNDENVGVQMPGPNPISEFPALGMELSVKPSEESNDSIQIDERPENEDHKVHNSIYKRSEGNPFSCTKRCMVQLPEQTEDEVSERDNPLKVIKIPNSEVKDPSKMNFQTSRGSACQLKESINLTDREEIKHAFGHPPKKILVSPNAPKVFALSPLDTQKQLNQIATMPTDANQLTNAFLCTSLGITSHLADKKDNQNTFFTRKNNSIKEETTKKMRSPIKRKKEKKHEEYAFVSKLKAKRQELLCHAQQNKRSDKEQKIRQIYGHNSKTAQKKLRSTYGSPIASSKITPFSSRKGSVKCSPNNKKVVVNFENIERIKGQKKITEKGLRVAVLDNNKLTLEAKRMFNSKDNENIMYLYLDP